jgi:hypothetical protein
MPRNEASGEGGSQQEVLRRRLADAEERYHAAMRDYAEAVDSHQDVDAIRAAERRKLEARDEYHRVLRLFSDLIVRGKPPKT